MRPSPRSSNAMTKTFVIRYGLNKGVYPLEWRRVLQAVPSTSAHKHLRFRIFGMAPPHFVGRLRSATTGPGRIYTSSNIPLG